ncbi:helix-turn-helix domain-containing protein [Pectinatus haikarae]
MIAVKTKIKGEKTMESMELMTAKEVAEKVFRNKIGYQVIIRLAHAGDIAHIQVGRKIFFTSKAVEAYLQGQLTQTVNKNEKIISAPSVPEIKKII